MTFNNFFRDKNGRVVVWQMPNLPLWVWIALTLLSLVIHTPGLQYVSSVFLFVWAYGETMTGDSPFRRVLGALVGLYLIVSHLIR